MALPRPADRGARGCAHARDPVEVVVEGGAGIRGGDEGPRRAVPDLDHGAEQEARSGTLGVPDRDTVRRARARHGFESVVCRRRGIGSRLGRPGRAVPCLGEVEVVRSGLLVAHRRAPNGADACDAVETSGRRAARIRRRHDRPIRPVPPFAQQVVVPADPPLTHGHARSGTQARDAIERVCSVEPDGLTIGTTDHAAPFQCSARGPPLLSPTATQKLGPAQETLLNELSLVPFGTGMLATTDQADPSHCSMRERWCPGGLRTQRPRRRSSWRRRCRTAVRCWMPKGRRRDSPSTNSGSPGPAGSGCAAPACPAPRPASVPPTARSAATKTDGAIRRIRSPLDWTRGSASSSPSVGAPQPQHRTRRLGPEGRSVTDMPMEGRTSRRPVQTPRVTDARTSAQGLAVSRTGRDRSGRFRPTAAGTTAIPSRARREVTGVARTLVVDEQRRPRRLGQQLGLARALHGDEPPRGLSTCGRR